MQIDIKTTNIDLTDAIFNAIHKKMEPLQHFIHEHDSSSARIHVEIGKPSLHHHSGPFFSAEANMYLGDVLLRATADHEDMYAALDLVHDELATQLKKHKEKKLSERRRARKES